MMATSVSTSLVGPTNPFPPLLTQRVLDMDPAVIFSETEAIKQSLPFPRVRYLTILLEQGKLGRNISCIMEQCMKAIYANEASHDYIQAVFEYIDAQVQAKMMEESEGISEVKRLRAVVRQTMRFFKPTLAERTALNVILQDALQRLPAHARG